MGAMLIIGMGKPSNKGTKHMNPMEKFLKGSEPSGSDESRNNSDSLVEDETSGRETGKITFNKPAGFKVPEGVQDGEAFDAMATVKLVNGKLVLSELDGTPVEDEHEGEVPEEEETEESETPAEDSVESKDSEPSTEEPEANDSGESEPEGFLDAIEKKASKKK